MEMFNALIGVTTFQVCAHKKFIIMYTLNINKNLIRLKGREKIDQRLFIQLHLRSKFCKKALFFTGLFPLILLLPILTTVNCLFFCHGSHGFTLDNLVLASNNTSFIHFSEFSWVFIFPS